jgi:Tfp pilus assembly protein PilN
MHDTEERTRQAPPTRVAQAERRGILSWPIAVGVVLVAIVLVLVGGAIAIRT